MATLPSRCPLSPVPSPLPPQYRFLRDAPQTLVALLRRAQEDRAPVAILRDWGDGRRDYTVAMVMAVSTERVTLTTHDTLTRVPLWQIDRATLVRQEG